MKMKLFICLTLLTFANLATANEAQVGVIIGSTTGLSVKFDLGGDRAIDGALSYSTESHYGMSLHADYLINKAHQFNVGEINPLNLYWSLGVVAVESQATPAGPPEVIGADAQLAARPAGIKPPLLMLVIGETARAANFALVGYGRPTNPELAKLPTVLSFQNVSSCGTSTAASLPCMFSPLGRTAHSRCPSLRRRRACRRGGPA